MDDTNVLIVEDESLTTQFLEDLLNELGYCSIYTAQNADEAIKIAKETKIDIAFMDINIDGNIDGIQCTMLLNSLYAIPTIFISAYNDDETITNASDTNIYGYIVKPFNKIDVGIALKIFQKRVKKNTIEIDNKIELKNDYSFNKTTLTLQQNNQEIKLTKKERNIILYLVQHINNYITYDQLRTNIWKNPNVSSPAIIDAMSRIRKKAPSLDIENYSGVGYRLCSI